MEPTPGQARTAKAREAAYKARKDRMYQRLATQLREAGWTVVSPEEGKPDEPSN